MSEHTVKKLPKGMQQSRRQLQPQEYRSTIEYVLVRDCLYDEGYWCPESLGKDHMIGPWASGHTIEMTHQLAREEGLSIFDQRMDSVKRFERLP